MIKIDYDQPFREALGHIFAAIADISLVFEGEIEPYCPIILKALRKAVESFSTDADSDMNCVELTFDAYSALLVVKFSFHLRNILCVIIVGSLRFIGFQSRGKSTSG